MCSPARKSRACWRRLDVPGILHRFLADPASARPAAVALAALLPRILATVEDGRARRVVARIVPRILGGPGAGRVVARALRTAWSRAAGTRKCSASSWTS